MREQSSLRYFLLFFPQSGCDAGGNSRKIRRPVNKRTPSKPNSDEDCTKEKTSSLRHNPKKVRQ